MKRLLRQFARETRLTEAGDRRIRHRLIAPERRTRVALRHLPGSDPQAEARVRERLAIPVPQRRTSMVLVAAVAALMLAALMFWPRQTPEPQSPGLLSVRLDSAGEQVRLRPAPGVLIEARGAGAITGTERRPVLEWQTGDLRVEVDPGQGLDLILQTPEARVRVLGTVFEVSRDALGTRVSVERGRVELTCAEASPTILEPDDSRTCLPRTAAGLLGRALTLEDRVAPAELVLDAVERGLSIARPGGPVEGELRYARLRLLVEGERRQDALDEARAYLVGGSTPRAEDVRRIVRALGDLDNGGE